MMDLDRHFARQKRNRIERDRRWLSRNRDKVIRLLRERDGDICLWCNKPNEDYELIDATEKRQLFRRVELHIDHIIPASHGGETDIDNLCLLHKECNLTKGDGTWPYGWGDEPWQAVSFAERVRQYRAEHDGGDDDERWVHEWLRIWPYP